MEKTIDLFVNGRLCLFGEHSDWAGQYKRFNSDIVEGNAIICGTEEGIYARVCRSERLEVETVVAGESEKRHFSCPMDLAALTNIAESGGFFSYVAGVAAHLLTFYEIGGLKIDCHKMTLPAKKGLSSSAAICVLTARAFNKLYGLNMTTRGEMEAAYHGEQLTPSRCGRLDQACAYGQTAVQMRFNGERIETKPLHIGATLYWVFADLAGQKDTIQILRDLNRAYPYPQDEKEKALHAFLGEENKKNIAAVREAISKGDAKEIGTLMRETQARFDEIVVPFSPEELRAEKLHALLADSTVSSLSYGGKGVGSQGDGCIQFIAKDEKSQQELKRRLEKQGLSAYTITLKKSALVRRAVVPVAGLGTRMYPATKVMEKELLPVVTEDLIAKPALLVLLEELVAEGIEKIALIIRSETRGVYERLFRPVEPVHLTKLTPQAAEYERYLQQIWRKIEFIEQAEPKGFGHAVYQSREFSQGEPVLLCLGDHLYRSNGEKSCTAQLISHYETHQKLALSIVETPLDTISLYGTASGQWEDREDREILLVNRFYEKPTPQLAEEELGVACKKTVKYFSFFGQYILTPEVYEKLGEAIGNGEADAKGEYQLTPALDAVREEQGAIGIRIQGRRFDLGTPEQYRETLRSFSE